MMISKLLSLATMLAAASSQMVFQPSDRFLNFASDVTDSDSASPSSLCNGLSFCERTRAFKSDVETLLENGE